MQIGVGSGRSSRMARANVKTEMKGTTSRRTTNDDAKKSAKKLRREIDRRAVREGLASMEAA
jgi:hypothetical protein